MKTYTYDPASIADGSINQMRFELGDTFVDTPDSCILCDEEYLAVINMRAGQTNAWKKAKINCLKAIVMKLNYEVDYKVEEMSISLSDRAKRFRTMLDDMEKDMKSAGAAMIFFRNDLNGGHYFELGMQENNKAKGGV